MTSVPQRQLHSLEQKSAATSDHINNSVRQLSYHKQGNGSRSGPLRRRPAGAQNGPNEQGPENQEWMAQELRYKPKLVISLQLYATLGDRMDVPEPVAMTVFLHSLEL